jgi:hypothetical protein
MAATSWYTTRETVRRVLDSPLSVRTNTQIDRAIAAASPTIDRLVNRETFSPYLATRTFDFPGDSGRAGGTTLYLGDASLAGIPTSVTVAGTVIPTADMVIRPQDGPPYTRIENLITSGYTFTGSGTWQQAVSIASLFGHCDDQQDPAGVLTGDATSNATTLGVSAACSAVVGTGSVIMIGSERMTVTGMSLADTGQTVQTTMANTSASQSLDVTLGTGFAAGETVVIGSERMTVEDIAGNTLLVRRAVDGSTIAQHLSTTKIYAYRTLTVTRADRGTTADAYSTSAALTVWVPTPLVTALAVAEAVSTVLQEQAGYARIVGSGNATREAAGKQLADLRQQVLDAYGRNLRTAAI